MKWSGWDQVNKWWVVDERLPYMGNDGGSHAHSVHSKKCQPVERLHWDCIVKVPTGWRVFHKESIWFLQRVEEIHSTHSKGREGFLQRVEESSSKVNGGKLQRVEVFPMLFNREFTQFIAKHDNECHIHDTSIHCHLSNFRAPWNIHWQSHHFHKNFWNHGALSYRFTFFISYCSMPKFAFVKGIHRLSYSCQETSHLNHWNEFLMQEKGWGNERKLPQNELLHSSHSKGGLPWRTMGWIFKDCQERRRRRGGEEERRRRRRRIRAPWCKSLCN